MDRPTGSSHWLIAYGHTPTYVVVNDLWGEPDLIHVTTLNANGIGAVIQPPELGQVLDGGAHRWRCLLLCAGQELGGGGGCHPLSGPLSAVTGGESQRTWC